MFWVDRLSHVNVTVLTLTEASGRETICEGGKVLHTPYHTISQCMFMMRAVLGQRDNIQSSDEDNDGGRGRTCETELDIDCCISKI